MSDWPELRKKLYGLLLSAFTVADLDRLLRYECNRTLEALASLQSDQRTIAHKIISNAEQEQWVEQLAAAAQRYNPTHQALSAVATQIVERVAQDRDAFYREVAASPAPAADGPPNVNVGSGAAAIGDGSSAVGQGGVISSGSVSGSIITGSTGRPDER